MTNSSFFSKSFHFKLNFSEDPMVSSNDFLILPDRCESKVSNNKPYLNINGAANAFINLIVSWCHGEYKVTVMHHAHTNTPHAHIVVHHTDHTDHTPHVPMLTVAPCARTRMVPVCWRPALGWAAPLGASGVSLHQSLQ